MAHTKRETNIFYNHRSVLHLVTCVCRSNFGDVINTVKDLINETHVEFECAIWIGRP